MQNNKPVLRAKPKPKPKAPEPPVNNNKDETVKEDKEKEKEETAGGEKGDLDSQPYPPLDPSGYEDGQPGPDPARHDYLEGSAELSVAQFERLQKITHEIKDKNRESLPLQEQVALDYSATEEAASILNMSEYSNTLCVMGMQSAGKTSILEGLMLLPLGLSAKGCATRACVRYRLRRNPQMKEPVCSVKWCDDYVTGLTLSEMTQYITRVMQQLKSIDMENILEVTIEDSRVMTLTLIDLPGFLAREEYTEEGLSLKKDDIARLALKILGEPRKAIQRILWVKNLETDKTLDNTIAVHRQLDPLFHRTIVAATHADVLKVTCPKLQELVSQLLQSWEGEKGDKATQPWLLALHQIDGEKKCKSPWIEIREEMKRQLEEQELKVEEHFDDLELPSNHVLREKLGWRAFTAFLQRVVNEDFINNAGTIISQLEAKEKRIRRKAKEVYGKINKDLLTESPTELARRGIMLLETTVNSLLGYEALEADFIREFGHTLEEEEHLAATYLGEHGISIPETEHIGLDVANMANRLFTRTKGIRVAAMLIQRLQGVRLPEFNDDQYIAAIPTTATVDILHIPAGFAALLYQADQEKLLPFIPYAVWRMAFVLHDIFKPSVALMRKRGFDYLVDNTYFMQALEEGYNEWVEHLAERCQEIITTFAVAFWRYESWNLPCLLEGLGQPQHYVPEEKGNGIIHDIGEEIVKATIGEKFWNIGGKLLEKMKPQESQEIGSANEVKEQLERHFESQKVLLATMINQAISGSILRATEPQKEARTERGDPRGPSLYEFLNKKLLSTSDMHEDPYCFSVAARDLEARSTRMEQEADTIKDLCVTLRGHLMTHKAYASKISLAG